MPLPASRTPEGEPNRCPLCGNEVKIVPSTPTGDAPCPHCGSLLWFVKVDPQTVLYAPRVTSWVVMKDDRRAAPGERPPDHGILDTLHVGDRVEIIDGTFTNFEGSVTEINLPNKVVVLEIKIFGRLAPVEVESWQIAVASDAT